MQKGNRVNSERIKEARLFRKMTMADLAESVGINKQAISQFENNKTTPEPLTLRKISEALDFPYSFFLEYDNPSTIFEHCTPARRRIWWRRKFEPNIW